MWLWLGAEGGAPGGGGQRKGAQGICPMSIQVWTQPGRVVLEEPSPCPSGPGPALQGLLGTPGPDQRAAMPVPKSALIEWARAWWHTRGGAGGLGGECIYKRCLQSKFHSILTSGLLPGALVITPPCTPSSPSLWGFVSLSLCNPCPDCYLRGTAFPAFVSSPRWAPGSLSKAFPGPFKPACAGGW